VQLNEANGGIEVVNNTREALKDLTVRAAIYDANSSVSSLKTYPVAVVGGSTTVKAAQIEVPARISSVYFVKLDLTDGGGRLLSTNFYWQNVAQDDFTGLEKLPTASVDVTATSRVEGEKTLLTVTLHNATETIALMTHLQLHKKGSGGRVLPVFYSDNYITLVPGETRTVTVEAATKDLAGDAPLLLVDGYNVKVNPVVEGVEVRANENADRMHWPASQIVPATAE
jgi:mannosylglycoprotein endo-beta-mannosidase